MFADAGIARQQGNLWTVGGARPTPPTPVSTLPCAGSGHEDVTMRHESSITSISWIPSEAITGSTKVAFDTGVGHYDPPPPDALGGPGDLDDLREADRFRFANRLAAYAEFDGDGRVVDAGYTGGGAIGATTMRLGPLSRTFQAFSMPDLRGDPERGDGVVRFTQTAGGRTGVPMPRKVSHPPFVQWRAPTAWTTLTLAIYADGHSVGGLVGASPFPRHWVYGEAGALIEKSGLIDFKAWSDRSFGRHSPWGDQDTEAFVFAVESALERALSGDVMRGGEQPAVRKLKRGAVLVEQGAEGDEVFLILDGVVGVEVNGERLAEYGPGAILGERAFLEGGTRTSTLLAVTKCKVAGVHPSQLDREKLESLAEGHRRESRDA
jgi:Cyclic nucleotide-binding domain